MPFSGVFPPVRLLLWRLLYGVDVLEGASQKGCEEEAGQACGQEVAGDGPGVEEWYSGRVVGVSYEEQGVEDSAGREDAGRVDYEGEDAGDEARQQGEREAEDEARAWAFPAGPSREHGGPEKGGRDQAAEQPDAHVDECQGGQVSLAAWSSLQDQEHERLREERLHEHEAEAVSEPDAQQSQEHHDYSSTCPEWMRHWSNALIITHRIYPAAAETSARAFTSRPVRLRRL